MADRHARREPCEWALAGNDLYRRYHDEEWGVPVRDDRKQFEFLTLESAQAGLSWACILNKREGYRRNFADFDAERVARFTAKRIAKILEDPGIVRNKLKVAAAVNNAQKFLAVQEEFGGFCPYIWSFVGGKPLQNRWPAKRDVPATSPESDALSKDLKRRGFKFVGSTIVYAHMQATGMVNDHTLGCFRREQVEKLG
ncbi:MAG TPA: DNA-3-methyladenine glycosylase I [Lacipirellulaceae bacterium]|nr:DNA-3-methyladenine glycosylase I [Lacipirellulaceae bacterium]